MWQSQTSIDRKQIPRDTTVIICSTGLIRSCCELIVLTWEANNEIKAMLETNDATRRWTPWWGNNNFTCSRILGREGEGSIFTYIDWDPTVRFIVSIGMSPMKLWKNSWLDGEFLANMGGEAYWSLDKKVLEAEEEERYCIILWMPRDIYYQDEDQGENSVWLCLPE
jgi:hypothetical protein